MQPQSRWALSVFFDSKGALLKRASASKHKFNMFQHVSTTNSDWWTEFHGYFGIFRNLCKIQWSWCGISAGLYIDHIGEQGWTSLKWTSWHHVFNMALTLTVSPKSSSMQRFPTKIKDIWGLWKHIFETWHIDTESSTKIDPSKKLRDLKVTVFHPTWEGTVKEMCQKFGQFQAGDISTAIDQLDICFKLWLSVSLEHFDSDISLVSIPSVGWWDISKWSSDCNQPFLMFFLRFVSPCWRTSVSSSLDRLIVTSNDVTPNIE